MASSLAKELCLSPAVKTSSMRRRSLEICQQLGTQLLSPSLIQHWSPSSSKTPSPSSIIASPSSSIKISTSPFKLINERKRSSQSPVFTFHANEQNKVSPLTTYQCKRRASDSFWIVESYENKVAALQNRQNKIQKHKCFLTPQSHNSSSDRLRNIRSYQHDDGSDERSTEKFYDQEANKDAEQHTCAVVNDDVDACQYELTTNRGSEDASVITCNIIPPTPLKFADQPRDKAEMPPLQFSLGSYNDQSSSESENGDESNDSFKQGQMRVRSRSFHQGEESRSLISYKSARRCSAAAKYDLDDNLLKLVALQWNLSLNPNELLGKGSFGTVIGGKYQGKQVAVKVLKTTNAQKRASILGEDNALNLPLHNHIARTMDIFQLGPDRALIIMEKMDKGNLLTLLNNPCFQMDCSTAINICKQVALALIFCHRQGILHLDVKPQNILVGYRNCCKLSDFGSSKKISDLENCYKHTTLEGTVPYTAPELFKGERPTEKCDVYSFAITMWQIISRETPYENENEHTVIFRVVSQSLRPGNNNKPFTSTNADEQKLEAQYIQLYQDAWDSNPVLRPSMTNIHKSLIKIQFSAAQQTKS